jgi:hypothetical protein
MIGKSNPEHDIDRDSIARRLTRAFRAGVAHNVPARRLVETFTGQESTRS